LKAIGWTVALIATAALSGTADARPHPGDNAHPRATIRTTEYGIPRIVADDYRGLGYGYGYALAEANICPMAEIYTTVRGERSKYFGPEGSWQLTGNGIPFTNLESDFSHKRVIAERSVQRILAMKPPNGPLPAVRKTIAGYVQGYNRWLREVGVSGIRDRTCRGKPWVKPITELDVYLRFYEIGAMGALGVAVDGTANAKPPSSSASASPTGAAEPSFEDFARINERNPEIGSNAVALGSEGTATGKGMLFANPHFPWNGTERFFESQLTVPGKVNVSGASIMGVPAIVIGHTRTMAWSHTISTARRFMVYRETLAPGDPTSYMVDGEPVKMKATDVSVRVKRPDGSIGKESRTLYSTKHGPIVTTIQKQALFPWGTQYAYSMRDPNTDAFRFINHYFMVDKARSVRDVVEILKTNQGVPWVNTMATDSKGKALYADISVVPDVTVERLSNCGTPGLGDLAWSAARVAVFDGSRPECDPQRQPGAVADGILPPDQMPKLVRQDSASNMNNSYWLANPKQPLEGFPPIIGDERTPRSLRTRNGLVQIEQRLAGTDGQKGTSFTLPQVQGLLTNNRNYGAELLAPDMVDYCEANPTMNGVSVAGACSVLAAWDMTDSLDSPGAVLWREVMARLQQTTGQLYAVPFDADDPVHTPRSLNTANPDVAKALADTVTELSSLSIPLDATLRDYQYVVRNGKRIPIPGGPGLGPDGPGVFNVIVAYRDPETGKYDEVERGSSFVMAASITGRKCPAVKTILTYSQVATDSRSKHLSDQTKLFSDGRWVTDRFCVGQQRRSPGLEVTELNGGARATRHGW